MMPVQTGNVAAQANRRRYEELRSIGQGATFDALPAATQRGAAAIAPAFFDRRGRGAGRLVHHAAASP